MSLIEAYNSIHNYDLIGIVETHLDDSISQERLALKGYEFITCNHQLNIKRGWSWFVYQRFASKEAKA